MSVQYQHQPFFVFEEKMPNITDRPYEDCAYCSKIRTRVHCARCNVPICYEHGKGCLYCGHFEMRYCPPCLKNETDHCVKHEAKVPKTFKELYFKKE